MTRQEILSGITRRAAIKYAAAGTAVAASPSFAAAPSSEMPNILWLVSEDNR